MSDSMLLVGGGAAMFASIALAVLSLARPSAAGGVARSLAQVGAMTGRLAPVDREARFNDRVLSPFAQRLVRLAKRLSPEGVAVRIQHHLDLAGNPPNWSVERVFAVKAGGLLVGLALGALFGARSVTAFVLWAAILGAAGFFVPDLLTWNKGLKRQEQIQKTLPDALDMLTVSVEAGLGFDAAMGQVTQNIEGPLAGEFARVLQEMQIGKGRADAFRAIGDRTTVPDLRHFVSALVQADKLGIPIANVLREQSREMRLKRRQRAEEKAHKIPVKILFPMILFIFPALFVVIIGPGVISVIRSFS